MKLSIVMPCLNEVLTLPVCIGRARDLLSENNIEGEVLISDNGSTDGSQELAEKLGARVIHCPVRGYGAALQYGLENARGEYVLMGDSDDSYHFNEAYSMVQKLDEGYDVCMGTRLKGALMPGAMPLLNRYIGNPALTFIGRIFFKIKTTDFHCGMRAFRRDKILGVGLVTTGMEWASEMVIKSRLHNLKMTEVPITLYKDGRDRPPHLRRWRDGWRHLRFMLLHAPNWLFIYPGISLVLIALILGVFLVRDMVRIGGVNLDVHSLLTMAFMVVLGLQAIFAGHFANLYAHIIGLLPTDNVFIKRQKNFSLERFLVFFSALGLIGVAFFFSIIWDWYARDFPALDSRVTMRQIIPALTLITISGQGIFNCFMLSLLFLKTKNPMDVDFKEKSD